MDPLVINESITIAPAELTWDAVRGGGPGGQNVNKVSSKVELRFDLPGNTSIPEDARERLREAAGVRLDAAGWVIVVSQKTRDQSRNLTDAMAKLRAMVLAALVVPKERKATAPSRAQQQRRLREKRHTSERKRSRTHRGED